MVNKCIPCTMDDQNKFMIFSKGTCNRLPLLRSLLVNWCLQRFLQLCLLNSFKIKDDKKGFLKSLMTRQNLLHNIWKLWWQLKTHRKGWQIYHWVTKLLNPATCNSWRVLRLGLESNFNLAPASDSYQSSYCVMKFSPFVLILSN